MSVRESFIDVSQIISLSLVFCGLIMLCLDVDLFYLSSWATIRNITFIDLPRLLGLEIRFSTILEIAQFIVL